MSAAHTCPAGSAPLVCRRRNHVACRRNRVVCWCDHVVFASRPAAHVHPAECAAAAPNMPLPARLVRTPAPQVHAAAVAAAPSSEDPLQQQFMACLLLDRSRWPSECVRRHPPSPSPHIYNCLRCSCASSASPCRDAPSLGANRAPLLHAVLYGSAQPSAQVRAQERGAAQGRGAGVRSVCAHRACGCRCSARPVEGCELRRRVGRGMAAGADSPAL